MPRKKLRKKKKKGEAVDIKKKMPKVGRVAFLLTTAGLLPFASAIHLVNT